MRIEGESAVTQMRHGYKISSSACVMPFVELAETSTGRRASKDVSEIICFGNQPDTIDSLETDKETRINEDEICNGNKIDPEKTVRSVCRITSIRTKGFNRGW